MRNVPYPILQTLSLLKEHQFTDIIAVQDRHTLPFIQAALCVPSFKMHLNANALSAGYEALGMALEKGNGVAMAVSETVLPLIQGALEQARSQGVSILLLSLREGAEPSEAPLASWFSTVTLERNAPKDSPEAIRNNLKINSAILETRHRGKGPSILRIQTQSASALGKEQAFELPDERVIDRLEGLDGYQQDPAPAIRKLSSLRRRMVIVGQMNCIYAFNRRVRLLLDKQFCWVAEQSSNATLPTDEPIMRMDEILYPMTQEELDRLSPELVITIGKVGLSRRLRYFLTRHKPVEHWHVDSRGELRDDFQGALSLSIEMDPFEFLEKIAEHIEDIPSSYPGSWKQLQKALPVPDLGVWCETSVIGRTIQSLPRGCSLHLSGGSVAEAAGMFSLPKDVEVLSSKDLGVRNGALLTMVSYARCSERLNFLLIGDMGALMDLPLLSGPLPSNARILVVNNSGSQQMAALPSLDKDLDEQWTERLTLRHDQSLEIWAQRAGAEFLTAYDADSLKNALEVLTDQEMSRRGVIVEARTDLETDRTFLKEHLKSLKRP